jgi:hypothetical protein
LNGLRRSQWILAKEPPWVDTVVTHPTPKRSPTNNNKDEKIQATQNISYLGRLDRLGLLDLGLGSFSRRHDGRQFFFKRVLLRLER